MLDPLESHHIEAMTQAFEAACFKLNLSKRDEALRDLVARKVIEWTQRGERDPERLFQVVVADIRG